MLDIHSIFRKKISILAPCSGELIELKNVKDPVFAEEMMGPGMAIEPSEGSMIAPLSGIYTVVATTGHAFGITSEEGLQVLVHIGIDTVDLKGNGFVVYRKQDGHAECREEVITADLKTIIKAGLECTVPVILTDTSKVESIKYRKIGPIIQGDWIMRVTLK